MSKLDELIKQYCPNGVKVQMLKEVCTDFIVPMRDRPKIFDGDIPWCRIEDVEGQYLNKSLSGLCVSKQMINQMNLKVFPSGTVICTCSASLGTYVINTQPLITNQTFIGLVCGDSLNNYYLRYYMETQTKTLTMAANSGTIPYISRKKFEQLSVPVPPLPVQQEIVRILDEYTAVTEELKSQLASELTARKLQYSYYRDQLLTFHDNIDKEMLGDVCIMKAGHHISANDISDNKSVEHPYPCYGGNDIRGYVNTFNQNGSYPIIGRQGALCGNVKFAEGKYYATEHAVVVTKFERYFDKRFLYYLLVYLDLNQYKSAGAQPGLAVSNLEEIIVPVPPLDKQKEIVEKLDVFSEITSDLEKGLPKEIELRTKQYEYYRDKLLNFKRKDDA